MTKYSFRVYLNNGSSRIIVPSNLKNTDLHDMDKYVNDCGYFGLCSILSSELGVLSGQINKIKILRNKKEIEFSLINDNKYLIPVLDDLHKEKVKSNKPYQMEVMVISCNNSAYQEMKKYLFDNLKKDYKHFLNDVYSYNNEFSQLLNKYGMIYNHKINNIENERELRYLEQLISTELRIYKNYRGICQSRKKYEEKGYTSVSKKNNIKVSGILYTNPNYTIKKEFPTIKELTQDYNEEYEEFLDEEEFESMTSEECVPKGYK